VGCPWPWSFLVSRRLHGQPVLGADFMSETMMVLDFENCRLYFNLLLLWCLNVFSSGLVWFEHHIMGNKGPSQKACEYQDWKGSKTFTFLFNFILFYSILFYSILFYSILFYSILFYSILFYSILFYSILYYSILFYSILFSTSAFLLTEGAIH
jgi:hypothetical protein